MAERARFGIQLEGFEDAARKVSELEQRKLRLAERARALKTEIRDLSKANLENTDSYEKLTKELGDVQASQTSLNATLQKGKRELRDQAIAVDAVEGSYEQLRAQARLAQTELSKINRTTQDGERQFRKAKAEVDRLEREIAQLSVTTGRTRAAFGGLTKSLDFKAAAQSLSGFLAVGLGVNELNASLEEFRSRDAALNSLSASLNVAKDQLGDYVDLATELDRQTLFEQDEILQAQAFAIALGRSKEETDALVTASLDLASATGQTVDFAVRNLNKTFSGLTGELGELLPGLRDLTKEELQAGAAVQYVTENFAGQAAVQKENADGLTLLQDRLTDARRELGTFAAVVIDDFVEGLEFLGEVFAPVVTTFERLPGPIRIAIPVIGALGVAIQVGLLGPIGIVTSAIGALIALFGRFGPEIRLGLARAQTFLEGFAVANLILFKELGEALTGFFSLLDPRNAAALIRGDIEAPWKDLGGRLSNAFSEGFQIAQRNNAENIANLEEELATARAERAGSQGEAVGVQVGERTGAGIVKGLKSKEKDIQGAYKEILELRRDLGETTYSILAELATIAYQNDLEAFKGTEEQKAQFAALRFQQLQEELADIRAQTTVQQAQFSTGLRGGTPLDGLNQRTEQNTIGPDLGEDPLVTYTNNLNAAGTALQSFGQIIQEQQAASSAAAQQDVRNIQEQIAGREALGLSTIGLQNKLAAAQARADKIAKQQARTAAVQAAAERTLALAKAFAGLGEDIKKGFPVNIAAVASTLVLLASTIATFRRTANTFKLEDGGDLNAIAGGSVPSEGGIIQGRSHADGGVQGTFGGRSVEVEGGEGYLRNGPERYVINKRSMADPYLRSLASYVNERGGGRAFATRPTRLPRFYQEGGPLTPTLSGGVIQATDNGQQAANTLAAFERKLVSLDVRVSENDLRSSRRRADDLEKAVTID